VATTVKENYKIQITALMKNVFLLLFFISILACQKEKITIGTSAQDLFYVENAGAKMPVLVEGNTASKVIILFVHGGPGGSGITLNNDENMTLYLKGKYATAFWDQRGSGTAQGNGALTFDNYVSDMAQVVAVLKHRYGADIKLFVMSHSWGGLIAPGYLTQNNNQNNVKGWINVAGAHNYFKNDSLTRAYLLSFGKEQITKNIHVSDWQKIVDFSEANIPNYDYAMSQTYAGCAFSAQNFIDDINTGTTSFTSVLFSGYPTSLFWMSSNAGSTQFSALGKDIIHREFSSKLNTLTLPILCITGKYDFTCPKGLAEEVINKVASKKKKLVILPHSGHICMDNEPEAFYKEVGAFIEENK
jgi:pimeloyl-ACP methyl ester carboxylesterase